MKILSSPSQKIFFNRVTPKKSREIEIKSLMAESLKIFEINGGFKLKFGLKMNLDGTVKPVEILKVLHDNFNLPIKILQAKINRTHLLSRGKNLLDI